MNLTRKNNQNGFTLIEIMVTGAITGVVALSIMSVFSMVGRSSYQVTTLTQIGSFKDTITAAVTNQNAWAKTILYGSATGMSPNSGMDCLVNKTPCTDDGTVGGNPITNKNFALYGSGGDLIFDATNTSNGLTTQGAVCSTFNTNGNDGCPFRFNLSWSAICQIGQCVQPQVKVTANLLHSPSPQSVSKYSFNPNEFAISLYSMPAYAAGPNSPPQVSQHFSTAGTSASFQKWTAKTLSTNPGNLLVVGLLYGPPDWNKHCTASVSDNVGNTYTNIASAYSQDPNSGNVEVWYVNQALGGVTKLTIQTSCGGDIPEIYFAEVSGIAPGNPLSGAPVILNSQPAALTVSAPPHAANRNDFLFSLLSTQHFLTGIAPGNPFNGYKPIFGDASAYYIAPLAGSYGAAWKQNIIGTYCATTVAFKSAN